MLTCRSVRRTLEAVAEAAVVVAVAKTRITMTEATLNRDLTHQHQDRLIPQLRKLQPEPMARTLMPSVSDVDVFRHP